MKSKSMEKLKEYNKKRNFNKTLEPKGSADFKRKSKKLLFVVQHHLARKDHYDLRLEWNGVFLSWAVPKGFSYNSKDKRLAIMVEAHPLEYANFEGVIPKGQYGGGTVMLWDKGSWQPKGDVDEAIRKGNLKFELSGERLKGGWAIVRLKSEEDNWLIIKEHDRFLNKTNTNLFTTSIKTGRTMEQIAEGKKLEVVKNPFNKTVVKLVKNSEELPTGNCWMYEVKYDGYRIIAYVEDNKVKLMTRNNVNYTKHFGNIAEDLIKMSGGRAMVLDGEMVVTNSAGQTNFQLMQNHMKKNSYQPTYVVFDILALDGKDLRDVLLIERKKILKKIITKQVGGVCYSLEIKGEAKDIFSSVCKMNLEGVIAKNKNSVYGGSRNNDWLKVKCNKRQEFVVGGYAVTNKKAKGISSLLLGYYKSGKFIYAGKVGTGMSVKVREDIQVALNKISQKTCPFVVEPKKSSNEKIFFVKPMLVAEVQFLGWTDSGVIRQASFKGFRTDKIAKHVVKESGVINVGKSIKSTNTKNVVNVYGVEITSTNKIMYKKPEIKKGDIINYYAVAAERMMPFIFNRLVSIKRCPKGVLGDCFFERNYNIEKDGFVKFEVNGGKDNVKNYFYINSVKGLIYAAQLNTIEFHSWACSVNNINKPDIMTFDLDPDEGMGIAQVREGVRHLKSVLDKLSLVSFLKTSGGKGYHVVLPFKPTAGWDKFFKFAKDVAIIMEQNWPNLYTSNIRKANRKNKIFIDWLRNTKSATSIAPYSVRAKEKGAVSMPISWSDLNTVLPDGVSMQEAIKLFKKPDPWAKFFLTDQQLK